MTIRTILAGAGRRSARSAVLAALSLGVATPALAAPLTYQVFDFSFGTTGTGITQDGLPSGQTGFAGQLLVIGGQIVGLQNASYGILGGTLGSNRYSVNWSQIVPGSISSSYSNTGTPTLSLSGLSWSSSTPNQSTGAVYTYYNLGAFTRGLSYTDSSFQEGDSQTDGLISNSIKLSYAGTMSVPEIDRTGLPVAGFVLGVGLLYVARTRRVRFHAEKLQAA